MIHTGGTCIHSKCMHSRNINYRYTHLKKEFRFLKTGTNKSTCIGNFFKLAAKYVISSCVPECFWKVVWCLHSFEPHFKEDFITTTLINLPTIWSVGYL